MKIAQVKFLSFIGGREHEHEALNHATQAIRQNGSAMKPLLVYAPAIEYGVIGAGSPVVDVKFRCQTTDGSIWSPSNYTKSMELWNHSCKASTCNFIKTWQQQDYIEKSLIDGLPNFLKKWAFQNLSQETMSIPLLLTVAMTDGITVEENTNAFATFANGGKFIDAYMIEKIEDMDGNIVYQHEIEPVDVFSPETSVYHYGYVA